jgi:NAD(P)-dependent dehydrogenase (short-subunit alcohol dehydrogenase family)
MTDEVLPAFGFADDAWPKELIPDGRVGDTKDLAGLILYLASRAGSYVNGNVLVVDGGRLGIGPSTY